METALCPDVERPIHELTEACRRLETIARQDVSDTVYVYHRTIGAIHGICEALIECEAAGVPCEELREMLYLVRQIHARSPFMRRLQEWPRDYAGDFETIEWLWQAENRAQGTFARALEQYALTSSIAQQHRNKVAFQAASVLEAQHRHSNCRVLSLACGSSPDLRSIVEHVQPSTTLVLCDGDPGALAFSGSALASLAGQGADGRWAEGTFAPRGIGTFDTLHLLWRFGLEPASDEARRAIAPVHESAAGTTTPASASGRARSSRASTAGSWRSGRTSARTCEGSWIAC